MECSPKVRVVFKLRLEFPQNIFKSYGPYEGIGRIDGHVSDSIGLRM
jgi:hypothetical protein